MPPEQIPLPTHVISERILSKSRVLYFPIPESIVTSNEERQKKEGPLHILWNHRWEWDKGPNLFFESLYELEKLGLPFVVSVIGTFIFFLLFFMCFLSLFICFFEGEKFGEVPPIFEEARIKLGDKIINWGFVEEKRDYFAILDAADIVVSTTDHEFFGVSVLEAIQHRCYPLCPNKLVFPEYLPKEMLYNTKSQVRLPPPLQTPSRRRTHNTQLSQLQLVKKLRYNAKRPGKLTRWHSSSHSLDFLQKICGLVGGRWV